MEYLILLGGNIGLADLTINRFEEFWDSQEFGDWKSIGTVHTSRAWGVEKPDQHPMYWNQARILISQLSPHEILMVSQLAQLQFQNQKEFQFDDREFDFDIIQADQLTFSSPQLQVPHPRVLERKFALDCIQEIAGDWKYPGQTQDYYTLWNNFQGKSV